MGFPIEEAISKKEALYKKGTNVEIVEIPIIWGKWFDWGFFKCKAYKKGTMHFEFNDLDVWGKFNQHIARIKGYPLFEGREQTAWQKRQNKTTNVS